MIVPVIQSGEIYTSSRLRSLGIDNASLARQAGILQAVRQGGRWRFRGADLVAWLAQGAPVSKVQPAVKAAVSAPASTPTVQASTEKPTKKTSATEIWERAMQAEQAKGLSRREAMCEVDRQIPGLRETMLSEANNKRERSRS